MPEPDISPTRSSRTWSLLPRFQFSLARLLIAFTLIAILLFVATRLGAFVELLFFSFVVCVVPTPLVIGAIYGRSNTRAFSIGGLVPWLANLIWHEPGPVFGGILDILWLLVMVAFCGYLAVITRLWIQIDDSR